MGRPGVVGGEGAGLVVAEPGDEAAHALRDRGRRAPVDRAGEAASMSAQVSGTSPGCSGRSSRIAGRPSARLERGDEVGELDRGAVADVVEAEGRVRGGRVGVGRVPVGIGQGRAVGGADHPLDDVVDIGEVAAVPALVEEPDRPALGDGAGEEHRRHVGPAPGAVDGEEAQAGAAAAGRGGCRHAPSARWPAWWRRRTAAGGRPPGPRSKGMRGVAAVDARGRGEGQVRGRRRGGRPRGCG